MHTFKLLSQSIYSGSMSELVVLIKKWLDTKQAHYVCVTGLHGLLYAEQEQSFARVLSRGVVVPDGTPLVWAGRLLGYTTKRIYGPDLMLSICNMAETYNKRVYLYGSTTQTLLVLKKRLMLLYPRLHIVGYYAPPFATISQIKRALICSTIKKTNPDIIFVGISTPKQEQWMNKSIAYFPQSILIGVGAAFDFISGRKKQAPTWIRHVGLEWLFRLCIEPRRLWKRYVGIITGLTLVVVRFPFSRQRKRY